MHIYSRVNRDGLVYDKYKQRVNYFPEVPQVLAKLKSEGYILGVASRTGEIRGANQLITHFGWDKYFTYIEIFPGVKTNHFRKLVS